MRTLASVSWRTIAFVATAVLLLSRAMLSSVLQSTAVVAKSFFDDLARLRRQNTDAEI